MISNPNTDFVRVPEMPPKGMKLMFRPLAATSNQTPRRTSEIAVCIFLLLHVPLALLMKLFPTIATAHALLVGIIGLTWAWNGRQLAKVACIGAYLAGSEVIWRSVGATVFWEYGKYASILIFVLALVRGGWRRVPPLPSAYVLALVPATLVTLLTESLSDARSMISFNLSGPLALAVSVVFFQRSQLSGREFLRVLIAFLAPIMGMVAIILLGLASASVTFGRQSNIEASGGFGANQVSALLGMGCVVAFLCVLEKKLPWRWKALFFGLVVIFGVQSALTFSRAGLYYAATSIAVSCLLMMKNLRAALQVLAAVLLLYLAGCFIIYPRLDEYTGGALSARFEDTRLSGRAEIMDADLKIMAEHPIFGIGVGRAMSERARFFKGFAAHTEFTRLLAEHGFFGGVAVVLLVIMGIQNVTRAHGRRPVAAALVTYSFCFMSGNGMRMVLPGFAFGLASVCWATEKRRASRSRLSATARQVQIPRLRGTRGGLSPAT
jgi:O-antigen ligase